MAQFRRYSFITCTIILRDLLKTETPTILTESATMSISASPRRNLPRTQSTANKKKSFIKYAKLGDEKSLLS